MSPEERRAKIVQLQTKFRELDQAKYDSNGDLARQRGNEFEDLIHDVFEAWGSLRQRAYHTEDNRSEQIDGAIQFGQGYAILEAKWEKKNLAASKLFSFLGKVDGKFVGTIGIFISRKQLTKNFLRGCPKSDLSRGVELGYTFAL